MLVGEGTPEGFPLPVAGLFAASAHMTGISAVLRPRCRNESGLGRQTARLFDDDAFGRAWG